MFFYTIIKRSSDLFFLFFYYNFVETTDYILKSSGSQLGFSKNKDEGAASVLVRIPLINIGRNNKIKKDRIVYSCVHTFA